MDSNSNRLLKVEKQQQKNSLLAYYNKKGQTNRPSINQHNSFINNHHNVNLQPSNNHHQTIVEQRLSKFNLDLKRHNSDSKHYRAISICRQNKNLLIYGSFLLVALITIFLTIYSKILTHQASQESIEGQLKTLKVLNEQDYPSNIEACPVSKDIFHVFIRQTEQKTNQELQKLPIETKLRIQKCGIILLSYKHLKQYSYLWNVASNYKIDLDQYDPKEKQQLLKLMHLYFEGGTYININASMSQINQNCWRKVIFGQNQVLFIQYKQNKQNQFPTPLTDNFAKVMFKHGFKLYKMIQKVILKQTDILPECKERRCLIKDCWKKQ